MDAVLVATLGAEPQVVTLATNLLMRQSALARVVALHTDAQHPPIDRALPALHTAWSARVDLPPLTCAAVAVTDMLTPSDFEHFANALFDLLNGRSPQRIVCTCCWPAGANLWC